MCPAATPCNAIHYLLYDILASYTEFFGIRQDTNGIDHEVNGTHDYVMRATIPFSVWLRRQSDCSDVSVHLSAYNFLYATLCGVLLLRDNIKNKYTVFILFTQNIFPFKNQKEKR